MRRSLGRAIILFGVLAAGLAVVVSVHPAAVGEASAAESPGVDLFLGFEVGEERRYAVGPDDALRDGEEITWSVRLERVESAGDRSVGVFELAHEHKRYGISGRGPMFVHWNYSGELRINEFGFPESVSFSMFEQHTGESQWRGEIMSADYTFVGDEYRKDVRVPDQQWEFTVPIATHGDRDLSVPAGLFLFRPEAADADFFTNPALLGFAVPDVLPDSWEQRTLFFGPTYPVLYPSAEYVRNERDRRGALRRYWSKNTLKLDGSARLEIGDRVLNVRKLDISGPVRGAYIDEFGRVVRMDIDPDPWTLKNRHIRLLFPTEY
jgi:hypothetical protein